MRLINCNIFTENSFDTWLICIAKWHKTRSNLYEWDVQHMLIIAIITAINNRYTIFTSMNYIVKMTKVNDLRRVHFSFYAPIKKKESFIFLDRINVRDH